MEENLTHHRVRDPGVRSIFTQANRWQAWLDTEAALASAEADLGVIPREMADIIVQNCNLEMLDHRRIEEALRTTEHSLMPLINELARVCGEEAGGYVHWGATTQNITQTGFILLVRRGHRIIFEELATVLQTLSDLAVRTKDMVLPGRTHGQHALPATFGFKVAMWIDELCRHVERLRQCNPRLFVAMLGGGAGTYASFGDKGPAIQARFGQHLGLGSMSIPGRTIVDHLTEYVLILVMLGTTCGKIAREVRELMKVEFGEVEEPIPNGSVASSTMPQKRNPKLCMEIIVLETELRSIMPLAVEAMLSDHEADGARTAMEGAAVVRGMELVGDILATMKVLMKGLRVFPERMRKNLDMTHGMIVTEHLMLVLGEYIGRQHAHHAVHLACERVSHDPDHVALVDALMEDPEINRHLTREKILDALQPIKYTGMCSQLAQQQAHRAEEVVLALRSFTKRTPETRSYVDLKDRHFMELARASPPPLSRRTSPSDEAVPLPSSSLSESRASRVVASPLPLPPKTPEPTLTAPVPLPAKSIGATLLTEEFKAAPAVGVLLRSPTAAEKKVAVLA